MQTLTMKRVVPGLALAVCSIWVSAASELRGQNIIEPQPAIAWLQSLPAAPSEIRLTTATDTNPPSILSASGTDTFTNVIIRFSEAVDPGTAGDRANYSISNLTVSAATLLDPRTVLLDTSRQTTGTVYTVTVRDIRDIASPRPNVIDPNPSTVTFRSFVFSRGFALHKFWDNISPNKIDALRADPRFPNRPTFTSFEPFLEYPPNGGNEAGSNYGNQLTAMLIPPITGNYTFYCSGDGPVEVYLNLDPDPANKILICREPIGNSARDWQSTLRRGDPLAPENRSQPIPLEADRIYYLEVLHTAGIGDDSVGVAWQLPGRAPPANGAPPIAGVFLAIFANPQNASVTITQQPQSTIVTEGTSASFSVGATGTGNLSYQWQKAAAGGPFADILDANSPAYKTPPLALSDTGTRYRVVVSTPGASATSAEARVTVEMDRTAPTVLFARRAFGDITKVNVGFSEPISATSGGAATNYTINNGVTVTAAAVTTDPTIVELTTSGITNGSSDILTINGVQDMFNNTIAPNTRIPIEFERGALLVHAAGSLNPSDAIVKSRLEARGYKVQALEATNATSASANGQDIVLISATISADDVGDKFQTSSVPVLTWEQALEGPLQMTPDSGSAHGATPGFTQITIVNPNHPLAAGLNGTVTVYAATTTLSWGVPSGSAIRVGAMPDDPAHFALYGYERGALMFNGFPAPARRVMFFWADNGAANSTAEALKLFDAAVDWAQNITRGLPGNRPRDYSIGLNFGAEQTNATLAATNVAGVPRAAQANWNNLSGASGTNHNVLADDQGAGKPTAVTVTWSSTRTFASTGAGAENNAFPTNADRVLMTGYLDTGNATTTSVAIANIPARLTTSGYDVYLYALGEAGGRGGAYRILDSLSQQVIADYVRIQSPTNSTGYLRAPNLGVANTGGAERYGVGNYIVFIGLTASNITIEASTAGGLGVGSNPRAAINAVQLVAPPSEPPDVTQPGDRIVPSSTNSPPGQSVTNAIDNQRGTKYLNFDKLNAGFTVTPGVGTTIVTGIGLTSANDAPERDPASYRLEGSNDGAAFTLISQGAVPPFSGRFVRQVFLFANTTQYRLYRVAFPTVADPTNANSVQIAEVELLGEVVSGPSAEEIRITSITMNTNNTVTLIWTGGAAPYVLQSKTNLSQTNWVDVLTTPNQTATVPATGLTGFYRVGGAASGPPAEQIRITGLSVSNQTATLTWTGGVAPYLIQRKTSLSDSNWVNILTTSNHTATVPLSGPVGFYRIGDHTQIIIIPPLPALPDGVDGGSAAAPPPASGAGLLRFPANHPGNAQRTASFPLLARRLVSTAIERQRAINPEELSPLLCEVEERGGERRRFQVC